MNELNKYKLLNKEQSMREIHIRDKERTKEEKNDESTISKKREKKL